MCIFLPLFCAGHSKQGFKLKVIGAPTEVRFNHLFDIEIQITPTSKNLIHDNQRYEAKVNLVHGRRRDRPILNRLPVPNKMDRDPEEEGKWRIRIKKCSFEETRHFQGGQVELAVKVTINGCKKTVIHQINVKKPRPSEDDIEQGTIHKGT